MDLVVEGEQGASFGMDLRSGATSEDAFAADRLVGPLQRIGIGRGQAAGFDGDVHAFRRTRGFGGGPAHFGIVDDPPRYRGVMTGTDDSRARWGLTLAPLAADPRAGLRVVAGMGVPGVQISAGQAGTRPRELDGSGRRDLLVAVRRLELEVVGVDAWLDPATLLEPERVDAAVSATLEAVQLAHDLGRVPVSTRLPEEGGESAIEAILARASKLGVRLVDHGVPPRGRDVRTLEGGRESGGLLLPDPVETSVQPSTPVGSRAIDGLGIGIDPPAWLVGGLDCIDAAARGVSAIRLADLSRDGMRIPVGDPDGRIDGVALVVTARTGGFEGMPVIDARRWPDPVTGVRRTLATLARV